MSMKDESKSTLGSRGKEQPDTDISVEKDARAGWTVVSKQEAGVRGLESSSKSKLKQDL